MEYNKKILIKYEKRAKELTTDKVEHELHQAITNTSGRQDS